MTQTLEQRPALSVSFEPGKPIEFLIRLVPVESGTVKKDEHEHTDMDSEALHEVNESGTTIPQVVESHHVGNIGERLILRLKMTKMKAFRNFTAVSYKYEFRDMNGNLYQWITYKDKGFEEGGIYDLKCTIQKYYERRGVKVTGITRCRAI